MIPALISLDFETSSEADLKAVGAAVYAAHPSTEVLCAAYGDPEHPTVWVPGMPPPEGLLEHVRRGGLVQAFNSLFEYWVWKHVCIRRYGWVPLPLEQTRDTMAQGRAFGLPGSLAQQATALNLAQTKDAGGKRLIMKFSVPRKPTKLNPMRRNYLAHHPEDAQLLYQYCQQDVRTEDAVSLACPPLSPFELDLWKLDQEINDRGMYLDIAAIDDCSAIVAGIHERLIAEFRKLTAGAVDRPSQKPKLKKWAEKRGCVLPNMQGATVAVVAKRDTTPPDVKRVLEIYMELNSTSVAKLKRFRATASADHRGRGALAYCGASTTARWAGRLFQPHNFPRGDQVKVSVCSKCGRYQHADAKHCPQMCLDVTFDVGGAGCDRSGVTVQATMESTEWNHTAALQALESFRDRDVDRAFQRWGDPIKVISGCLRALIVAPPGHRLIASDFCAIEAVVIAALAGEEWRLEVFRTHGKIYEMSVAKIMGKSLQFYLDYKARTDTHHPDRKVGKIAELASGYQGSVGAWDRFGARKYFKEEDLQEHVEDWQGYCRWCISKGIEEPDLVSWYIKQQVKAWRAESPNIVAFWGALEAAAFKAVQNPGTYCRVLRPNETFTGITYHFDGSVLRAYLPSGRPMCYQDAKIIQGQWDSGEPKPELTYMGLDEQNRWVRQSTYGGKLCENVTQAAARDILAHAMLTVDRAEYPIVLTVHDEIITECPDGFGSVAELERLMDDLPEWATGWPVYARDGWEGREYRKD